MEWIAEQEGIEADAETLSVLAQAGEGSVRDSLSALDQAIACCGTKLKRPRCAGCWGCSSLESLEQVAQALVAGDSHKMLEVVAELEANGRSLQHFRAGAGALFPQSAGGEDLEGEPTRLVAASPGEQERMLADGGAVQRRGFDAISAS